MTIVTHAEYPEASRAMIPHHIQARTVRKCTGVTPPSQVLPIRVAFG